MGLEGRHQIRKDHMSVNGCDNAPAWPRDNALGRHLDHFLFRIEFIWGGKQRMDLSHTLFCYVFYTFYKQVQQK